MLSLLPWRFTAWSWAMCVSTMYGGTPRGHFVRTGIRAFAHRFSFWYGSFWPIALSISLRAILARGCDLDVLQVFLTYIPNRKRQICPAIKCPLNRYASRMAKKTPLFAEIHKLFSSSYYSLLTFLKNWRNLSLSSSRRNKLKRATFFKHRAVLARSPLSISQRNTSKPDTFLKICKKKNRYRGVVITLW